MSGRGRRTVVVAVAPLLVACSLWAATGMTASPAGAAGTTLATPGGVTASPGVGTLTISWSQLSTSGVTYRASSTSGATCAVIDAASCTIPDTATGSPTFTVTASKTGFTSSAPSAPTAPIPTRLVIVVAGQSNANGYESYAVDPVTGVNYMAPPMTNGADSHDLITWEPWSQLPGTGGSPVPLDSPQQAVYSGGTFTIFGPEIGLARQLWTDTGRAVTIVKCAYTGTSLDKNWTPKPKKSVGSLPLGLFPATVAKVKATMAADAASGTLDVLGGIVWDQGESDATNPSWAARYQDNLTGLIAAFRASLPMSASAPFALAETDLTEFFPYLTSTVKVSPRKLQSYVNGNAEVRAADVWAAAHLPDVVVADTADLPRASPSLIHLTNVGQLTIGARLAKAMEPLLP